MLREAPLLPDRAVTGLLEPRIGAIGSMVTSQTGQYLCDRGPREQAALPNGLGLPAGEVIGLSREEQINRSASGYPLNRGRTLCGRGINI